MERMQRNVKKNGKNDVQNRNNREQKKIRVGDSANEENVHPVKKCRMDFGEVMPQLSDVEETNWKWSQLYK